MDQDCTYMNVQFTKKEYPDPTEYDAGMSYAELNFTPISPVSKTVPTGGDTETSYAQVQFSTQVHPPTQAAELTPPKGETQTDAAGGNGRINSTLLPLVGLVILICALAIIIGLTVHVLQVKEQLVGESQERAASLVSNRALLGESAQARNTVSLLTGQLQELEERLARRTVELDSWRDRALALRARGDSLLSELERMNETLSGTRRNLTVIGGRLRDASGSLAQARGRSTSFCEVVRQCRERLCSPDWKQNNGHCYYFSEEAKSWESAKIFCESKNSHLVVINTSQQQEFIVENIRGKRLPYWIGLSKDKKTRKWKWVDGTNLSSGSWKNNRLYQYSFGDCATLQNRYSSYPGVASFSLDDDYCESFHSFICQKCAEPSFEEESAFSNLCSGGV
ncbi:C-type lectin domain family 10 member A-like [Heterodontus francisci]|uniref:C-type lectin domain family 10 member A-like n=1 Tax=Heterodontus francisci TaxID=7792 RepID=UPI00355C7E22